MGNLDIDGNRHVESSVGVCLLYAPSLRQIVQWTRVRFVDLFCGLISRADVNGFAGHTLSGEDRCQVQGLRVQTPELQVERRCECDPRKIGRQQNCGDGAYTSKEHDGGNYCR